MVNLEQYFKPFRDNTIGIDVSLETPFGKKQLIYADWIASGRLYKPIEDKITNILGPFIGNPHTESDITAGITTDIYLQARQTIKKHVNASEDDVLISVGYGMTSAINKFLRILGLRITNDTYFNCTVNEEERPVVFISSMEHHSNQIPWQTTVAEIVRIGFDEQNNIDLNDLESKLKQYQGRKLFGSFTSASNVTGIKTNVRSLATLMHRYGGYCFVDFAGGGPYLPIDMHPQNEDERLDAIFFSPHKFLGGPGSAGILIFNKVFYQNAIPDHPGGGTVLWTDPWEGFRFFDDIEIREDGGTPGFLQTIKAALAISLKETMGCDKMLAREEDLLQYTFKRLDKISNIIVLLGNNRDRLAAISFNIQDVHYNLVTRLLNDMYGIQVRGGCACAGTYGHLLFNIDPETSHKITQEIERGNLYQKPGFVRMSLHPTMTMDELKTMMDALEDIAKNYKKYTNYYRYDKQTNEFFHHQAKPVSLDGFFAF